MMSKDEEDTGVKMHQKKMYGTESANGSTEYVGELTYSVTSNQQKPKTDMLSQYTHNTSGKVSMRIVIPITLQNIP